MDSNKQMANIDKQVPSNVRFIKITGTFHQYKNNCNISPNIRLTEYKDNKFQYDSLDSINNVVYTVICKPQLNEFLITLLGDSIMCVPSETDKDSIIPRETYQYSIKLIKEGEYNLFYSNGSIHTKGKYSNDLKHGKWIIYDEKGKVVKREKWYYGVLKKTW